ncbi:MAG: hypothetical protein GKR89_03625 [Candidatus Latescibacteria bacterium]|nr:hypothetical protein [Candidatus Latescibacterota bacterium]
MYCQPVKFSAPIKPQFTVEPITATAGHKLSGGSGASCWGYNQSNIIRHQDQLYALSWRDDLSLVVYRRLGPSDWEASPTLPPVPQNGNLLVDGQGRLHLISGKEASWHALFDPPGQVQHYQMRQHDSGDSRFGAAINEKGQILVAGGLAQLAWYVLDPTHDYRSLASGHLQHPQARGYHFTIFHGTAAHTFCSDDYFVAGDHFPNQQITTPNPHTGALETVETQRGIYPVLKAYYYYNPDILAAPHDWRLSTISDVSDTNQNGARGTTEQQDLLFDTQGRVHLIYFQNRQPATTVWASQGQDLENSRLYHAVGPPGGPFEHFCLGNYNSGRLYQSPDGRLHYLLTKGRRGAAQQVHYAVGQDDDWAHISKPFRLRLPGPFWHLSINTPRAGGTRAPVIDCYWTGPYGGNSNQVWYGCLTP